MSHAQEVLNALPALKYIGIMRTRANVEQLDAEDLSLSYSCVYFRVIPGDVPRLQALGEDESHAIHKEMLSLQPSS